MIYRPNRDESEEGVRMLADEYPKCFFENPRLRRPLKRKIVADLVADGVPMAHDLRDLCSQNAA
jgi:hypothetical protein